MEFLSKLLWIIAGLAFLLVCKATDTTQNNGQLVFKLFHSFDSDNFIPRGSITIAKNRNLAHYKPDTSLSKAEIDQLKTAAAQDGNYYLKAVTYKSNGEIDNEVITFVKACSIYGSNLKEKLIVNLDQDQNLLALHLFADNSSSCSSEVELTNDQFESNVFVSQTTPGPVPDTQTYIQRIEQERLEKVRGDGPDNRSFLAKYWIYIVPIAIFLLISSASNQDGPAASG